MGEMRTFDSGAVEIPSLYCPFPPGGARADAAVIHAASLEWAVRQGLLTTEAERKFADGNRIAWGLGLAHPQAPAEAFQLLTDWLLHFCLFDSYVEERLRGEELARVCTRFMEVLWGAPVLRRDMPYVVALGDIRQRLLKLADEALLRRFADTLERCLEVYILEDARSSRDMRVDPQAHLELKTRTGGFYSWWVLAEVVEGFRVPAEVLALPLVQSTLRLAAEAGELANDLFTLRREIDQGNTHNLVLRLGVPLAEGIACVASLHDATMASLCSQLEQLTRGGEHPPELGRLLQVVSRTLRAHMDWAQRSQRALGWSSEAQAPAPAPRRADVTLSSEGRDEPCPVTTLRASPSVRGAPLARPADRLHRAA
jgi:hypothetical protein